MSDSIPMTYPSDSWRDRIITRLRREAFVPTLLSLVINPFYIARSALHHNLRELAPRVHGDVLDFGCGSKPYAALFTSAKSYVGVDIQVSGHDHRKSKVDHFYDGKTLPFDSQRYDAVVTFQTLEHLFNPSRMLAEINRVTRTDGLLLLTVPFVWDEHEVPYDFARYTSYGLRHILEAAGYDVLEFRKSTTYVLTVAQMALAYLHQNVFPKRGVLRHLCQLLVIFPFTLLAYLINGLLPKRDSFFCDSVVLARKVRGPRETIF